MNFNGFILDTEIDSHNCEGKYLKLLYNLENIVKIIGVNNETINNKFQTQNNRLNETYHALVKIVNENKEHIEDKSKTQKDTNQTLMKLINENREYVENKNKDQEQTNQSLIQLISDNKTYTNEVIKSQQDKIEVLLSKNVDNKIQLLQQKLDELHELLNTTNKNLEEKSSIRLREIKYSDACVISIIEDDSPFYMKGMFLEAVGYEHGLIKVRQCRENSRVIGIYVNKNFMSRSSIQDVLVISDKIPIVGSPISISNTKGFGEVSEKNIVGYIINSVLFHGNIYKCLSNINI